MYVHYSRDAAPPWPCLHCVISISDSQVTSQRKAPGFSIDPSDVLCVVMKCSYSSHAGLTADGSHEDPTADTPGLSLWTSSRRSLMGI